LENLFATDSASVHADKPESLNQAASTLCSGPVFSGLPQDNGGVHSFCTNSFGISLFVRLCWARD
jgi:hypothetical protein